MADFTLKELSEAHRALLSTLHKCEKMDIAKLGKSQQTLLQRRIAALKLALTLIEDEQVKNMNWLNEVQNRIKRKNQILFAKDSKFLADLTALIQEQNHRTMVLWAFEFADETVQKLFERYPNEERLQSAVLTSKDWAAGKVKMPVAQRAILQAHAVAKELESLEDIALCHAIGQACGVVHATGHAIGFPIYDLTAIIRHYGVPECKRVVEKRKQQYIDRIYYWREHYKDHPYEWAEFMMVD